MRMHIHMCEHTYKCWYSISARWIFDHVVLNSIWTLHEYTTIIWLFLLLVVRTSFDDDNLKSFAPQSPKSECQWRTSACRCESQYVARLWYAFICCLLFPNCKPALAAGAISTCAMMKFLKEHRPRLLHLWQQVYLPIDVCPSALGVLRHHPRHHLRPGKLSLWKINLTSYIQIYFGA